MKMFAFVSDIIVFLTSIGLGVKFSRWSKNSPGGENPADGHK